MVPSSTACMGQEVSASGAAGLAVLVLCTCLGPERKRSHSNKTSGAETMTGGRGCRRSRWARYCRHVADEPFQGVEQVRAAEVIGALCLATDLGMGFPFE